MYKNWCVILNSIITYVVSADDIIMNLNDDEKV